MLPKVCDDDISAGIQQLQGRHNVPQDKVAKIKSNVSMYVPIIPEEISTRISNSSPDGFKGFIKSIESSPR